MIYLDIMHVMDCKGVTASVWGSILAALVSDPGMGKHQQVRLHQINMFMKAWYSDHPGVCKLPNLRMNNVFLDGWADLHGPAIKAAMIKEAAPLFLALVETFMAENTPANTATLAVVKSLNDFYEVLYTGEMFLTDLQVQKLREACKTFWANYLLLRSLARDRGRLWWQVRPKHHKMQHFPFFCADVEPKVRPVLR